jgi:hypothetical protein
MPVGFVGGGSIRLRVARLDGWREGRVREMGGWREGRVGGRGGWVIVVVVTEVSSGMVARRAASRAAPPALRAAAICSVRCTCSSFLWVLAGSWVLVGRGRAPRPPPRPRVALVLGASNERGSARGVAGSVLALWSRAL